MAHSRWSPSSASREAACPASFLPNDAYRRKTARRDTVYTSYGTAGHYIGEQCLRYGHDPDVYLDRVAQVLDGEVTFVEHGSVVPPEAFVHPIDREMIEAVQLYVDRCRAEDGDHYVEVQVDHTPWCPDVDEFGDKVEDQKGTSDHICVNERTKTLFVDDLKMGRGLKVEAKDNYQALSYALGTVNDFDFIYGFDSEWTVVSRIHQPLLEHFDEWVLTYDEAMKLGAWLKERRTLGLQEDAPFAPGEKTCKFCAINGSCRAYQTYYQNARALQFDEILDEFPEATELSDEELVEAWRMVPMIKQAFGHLDAEMHRRIMDGRVTAMKLVESKSHRQFTDVAAAEKFLLQNQVPKDKIWVAKDPSFVSPAQAEKLLPKGDKRKALAKWVKRPPGKPVIVDAKDPRPVFDGAADIDMFDETP